MKKNRILFLMIVFLIISLSCLLKNQEKDSSELFSVYVHSNEDREILECWKSEEGVLYIFLPSYADMSQLTIKMDTDTEVYIDGDRLLDGMDCSFFQLNQQYEISYYNLGIESRTKLTFLQSSQLATMYINTQSNSMEYIHANKGNEESGFITLYTCEGEIDYKGKLDCIKGRGNNTWKEYEKKPYSINFSEDINLLGLGSASKWILLANADDSSNLRNKIVYDFANSVGLEYSPNSTWVDLYLNGEYAGLYLLCERNEIHENRVNIAKEGSSLVSLEIESRLIAQNYNYILTETNQALRIHYPKEITSLNIQDLERLWQSLEYSIVSEDGVDLVSGKTWMELIDIDSWAKKYLIEEVFGNFDGGFISQYFYYDSRKDKFYAGPVWDFDHSIGNPSYWELVNPKSIFANRLEMYNYLSTTWFYNLCKKVEFKESIKNIYTTTFLPMLDYYFNTKINQYSELIVDAAYMNRIRWFDSPKVEMSAEVRYMQTYMKERILFLNDLWINDGDYHLIRFERYPGGAYAYHTAKTGNYLESLPTVENTEDSVFLGWYYEGNDEPFDITQPIYEDIELYAKWEFVDNTQWDTLFKLVPLAVLAGSFMIVLGVNIKRMKEDRR